MLQHPRQKQRQHPAAGAQRGALPMGAPPLAHSGRAMRVVHFTDSLEPSGVGQHIYLLARELRALGHTQALVCPATRASQPLLERCAAMGMEVWPLCVRGECDAADYRRLVELLLRDGHDLVHVHAGITWEGCWGAFAAAEASVPAVWTEHLPYLIDRPEDHALRRRASRTVEYTVGVSRGVAHSLVERGVVSETRTRVVWNGIDIAPFSGPRQP